LSILLEVRNLSKSFAIRKSFWRFGSEQEFFKAVVDVSLDLERGKVLVLAGESGSGKTTVARLIIRAIDPDPGQGSIRFDGIDVTRYSGKELMQFRTSVHMIYQDPYASLNPRMSIMDIVMEPLNIHDKRSSKREKIERVLKALEDVRLKQEAAVKLPHMLSGGEKQRVAIARAIVLKPKLIVADEPVSMLDVSIRAEILSLITDLKERYEISWIYITHDLSTARVVGETVAIMHRGQIVERGPIDNILLSPSHSYTQALINAIPDIDSTNDLSSNS
jgi:peptide/nickel transport system ATP-binding protein